MITDVVVPQDLWDTEDEGVLLTWVYADGATVQQGKLIAELMVEKAQLELEAPASGRLRILVQPDAVIKKGQVLARIEPA
jgi:pyruvate/2-oxoglutarate dehydrogenase complex dihydrolipoamide acyltransferase (E2) component